MNKLWLLLLLISFSYSQVLSSEEPWGHDACLASISSKKEQKLNKATNKHPISSFLITFHQKVISPADGPRSSFYPGSSEYTRLAIIKYGFFKGFIMGCDRLLRENNEKWVYPKHFGYNQWLKYDPVK